MNQVPNMLILAWVVINNHSLVEIGQKHIFHVNIFAVFLYKLSWNWDSLPKSYLNGAYLCADASSLAQALMLVASNNEGKNKADVIDNEQTS